MSPTLQPRDVLLIAPVQMSDWKYLSGGVYAVLFGQDHLVVKRVERNALATEGILRLVSDNPTGGHLDLPGPDLKAIFRVLAITRNL
jgi:phage repressor protein C with HTH and peptisase S24 domain